jgi:hypothetical protein
MRFLTQHRAPSRNPYRTQNPVRATSCGFESHLRHNVNFLQKRAFAPALKFSFVCADNRLSEMQENLESST